LTLQFGVMASSCKNETEYLNKAKDLIKEIQKLDKSDLSDIFFGYPPDKKYLLLTLKKILINISEIEQIPEDKRHYEF
jgi:acyl-CoA hydrolase